VHKCKRLWHVQGRQPANQRACTVAQSATWIDKKRRLVATTHPSRYLQRTHCQSCDRVYICLQSRNRTRGEPPRCLKLHVCSQACGDGPARRSFPAAGAYVFVAMGLVVPSLSPAMRISSAMVPRSQMSGACSSLRGQPWLLTGPPWADVSIDPPRLNAVCRSSSLRLRLYSSSRWRFTHHPPARQLSQPAKALCSCKRLKLVCSPANPAGGQAADSAVVQGSQVYLSVLPATGVLEGSHPKAICGHITGMCQRQDQCERGFAGSRCVASKS
jgi:hypothetical protein